MVKALQNEFAKFKLRFQNFGGIYVVKDHDCFIKAWELYIVYITCPNIFLPIVCF